MELRPHPCFVQVYSSAQHLQKAALTHSGGENHNSQHVHALAGAWRGLHDDIRGRSEIQREVLHVSAIVILDAVDVDPARGGLIQELSHRGLGDELRDPLGAVLQATGVGKSASNNSNVDENKFMMRF